MLDFITPMLAKAVDNSKAAKAISSDEYVVEPKHDGMRALVVKDENGVEIYSRTGKKYSEHLPRLVEFFNSLDNDGSDSFILDGELAAIKDWVSIEGQNVPIVDFNATMRVMGSNPDKAIAKQEETPITFIAFDLLHENGIDLLDTPFDERSRWLYNHFYYGESLSPVLYVNPVWHIWTEGIFSMLMDAGIEGAIIKHVDSVYMPGKRASKAWWKMKIEQTADVVVMGFHEAKEGKFFGQIGAIKFGAFDDQGDLRYVGKCSGMDDAERQRWTNIRDTESEEQWNKRVIEVRYNDLVGSDEEYKTPRHPQFVIERIDKNPEDCLMEQFKA